MADRLRKYKAAHGRYPSTDEGLPVLSDYQHRFSTDGRGRELWGAEPVRWTARAFRERRSRWPTNQGELWEDNVPIRSHRPVEGIEVAISREGEVYLLYHGETLSAFNRPFCYENLATETGEGAGLSLAPPDPLGMHSVKVDDGVVLYSPGAEITWNAWVFPKLVAGPIAHWAVAAGLALWWLACWRRDRRSPDPKTARIRKWGIAALVLVFVPTIWPTSQGPLRVPPTSAYRKEVRQAYLAIQNKYHAAGLITDETFQRRLRAAMLDETIERERARDDDPPPSDDEPSTQPAAASAPATRP
ncbi:MAG TPA: hypothetical protein VM031_03485 [Phycisphaerae bacterium]|nr:hypothetical protein [Phycisphaerae bacterium]